MAIHTTDAIVLRQYAYRETSVLVSCLTERFGKIKGLIKGLRGDGARFRSAMEPMTLNRIVFYDSRTSALCLISQCELTGPLQELTRDLETIRLAALCVELADALIEPGEPQTGLFLLVRDTLERIADHRHQLVEIRIHFIFRLLYLVGFQPQLDECAVCGRHPEGPAGRWSVRQGGLLCEGCLHEDPHAQPISAALLDTLARCRESHDPVAIDPDEVIALRRHLDEFLSWRVERPLKTLGMPRLHRAQARHHVSLAREASIA